MPSFFSGAPKETPSSDFSTTNAEMPLVRLVGVGHGHHRVVLGLARVGDPALHAVEDPEVAVADGLGLHAGRVRARVGLGEAYENIAVALGERAQVLLLQLLGAGEDHGQRAELVHRRDQGGGGADPRHLLDHDDGGQRVGARAAVRLRHVHRVQVAGDQRVQRLLREAGLLVHRGGVRARSSPRRGSGSRRGACRAPRTGGTGRNQPIRPRSLTLQRRCMTDANYR